MSKNKLKLHEILAFEQDVKNKSKAIVDEATGVFSKKDAHFDGVVKQYERNDETGEELPTEKKEVVTTVAEKMAHVTKAVVEAINTTLTKEETNSSGTAKADLIIGDKSFGQLAATSLLSLENTLIKLRNGLYHEIPTLDPTKNWNKDTETTRPGMHKSDTNTKFRTVAKTIHKVVVPATEHHPAQVASERADEQVGKYLTTDYSGKIRPRNKSAIIERLDQVIFAVKQARARANNVEVVEIKIAKDIMDYVHGTELV